MRNPFDPNAKMTDIEFAAYQKAKAKRQKELYEDYYSRQGMLSKDFNEKMGWDYKDRIRQLHHFQDPRRSKHNDRPLMRHYLKVNTYEIMYEKKVVKTITCRDMEMHDASNDLAITLKKDHTELYQIHPNKEVLCSISLLQIHH